MSQQNEQHSSLAGQIAQEAAGQVVRKAAGHLARQALLKVGAALGAKGAVIVGAMLLVIAIVIMLIMIIVAVISAGAQQTTTVWPVPVATDTAGIYKAGGWSISSRFGWRDSVAGDGSEFHDGIDLVNPLSGCPFGYRCGVPAMFDGSVRYVGWDVPSADDPSKEGGGIVVRMQNGTEDHETVYAHLEPYRLYIQLQGRIDDPYDTGEYDSYRGYQPIGQGDLWPDASQSGIEISCLGDMPNFVPTQSEPGTIVFLYDRPATCLTTVQWGERGNEWQGWLPDDLTAIIDGKVRLPWTTGIEPGKRAKDIALTFKARLVPPPPPPTETPTATLRLTPTPTPSASGVFVQQAVLRGGIGSTARGGQQAFLGVTPTAGIPMRNGKPTQCVPLQGGWTSCTWAIANIPIEQERLQEQPELWITAAEANQPTDSYDNTTEDDAPIIEPYHEQPLFRGFLGQGDVQAFLLRQEQTTPIVLREQSSNTASSEPNCSTVPLVLLPGVRAPNPRLAQPAAESFAQVRAEIEARVGRDILAVLSDVSRAPSFETAKPGVLRTSWHKAGRAIDVNTNGPFIRVAEGQMFRLYVGNVDITAIFEAHGWQRIPAQGDTPEWWHYEFHPDGISWASAMLQVWSIKTLKQAFPEVAWDSIGCTGGSNTSPADTQINLQDAEYMCVLGSPQFDLPIEFVDGCGPPVRAGDKVRMLDDTLGFVGLTGETTGPHLHLGLRVKSYQDYWPQTDICSPGWLEGRVPSSSSYCYTDMADPLAFLPQAPPGVLANGQMIHQDNTAQQSNTVEGVLPEGAPFQLPPPNYPDSLVFTPVPDATPVGQYWSPYTEGGRYGGGGVGEWICANVWSGFAWCPP